MDRIPIGERARRGKEAETLAAAYLRLRGCTIIGRNLRIGGGEIDLAARFADWLLLVEVRFREGTRYGHPAESVCGRKARALARAARAYVAGGIGEARCWRLDVISVVMDAGGTLEVRHFPAAVPLDLPGRGGAGRGGPRRGGY